MPPCFMAQSLQRGGGRTEERRAVSSPSCGIMPWRLKAPWGNPVVRSPEMLFRSGLSTTPLASPFSCGESIGVRPSPSAKEEGGYGRPSAGMIPISASTWPGPTNSRENTRSTGSSMTKSFSRPRCWPAEMRAGHPPCFGPSRKPSPRLWDARSILWIRGRSPSILRVKAAAGIPFRWVSREGPRRGFPKAPAGPLGCARFLR